MKKIICLLLGLILISTLLLSSCDDTPDDVSKDKNGTTSQTDGKYVADIPDVKFDGRTFTFLTCGVNADHESEIVYNDPEDGGTEKMATVVNEAISTRNRLVEEQLDIEIKEQYIHDAKRRNGDFATTVRNNIQAGTGNYQAVVPCIYDAASLAASGFLKDLTDIPHLNLSQPWWDQTFNEELTINDKLYFTVGDIGILNKSATAALMFNKNLIEEQDLEDPYELVKNKEWTLDKVTEMAQTISVDEDQNGIIDYKDSMGWSGQLDDMWNLFYSSGEKIGSIGADGFPRLSMYNERSTSVVDKMLKLVKDDKHYISANDYFDQAQWPVELTIQPFLEGRCLFFSSSIVATDSLADMEDEFGIVPVPLYDESQEDYHSFINPWVSTCFAVPRSVTSDEDCEFVGIVLEAMGAESRNHVYKAYYEVALKYQNTRDDDSIEMLDKIFTTRGCDIGIIYAWGGLDIMLQELASQDSGAFTSNYDAKKEQAKADLEKTVEFFEKLD